MRTLIWSFASLQNMDQAIEAIRRVWPSPVTIVSGHIDGNVYWCGPAKDVEYVTGICRGVAHAMRDGSIG